MTGREAIEAVRQMEVADRYLHATSEDPTLAQVCRWTISDPEGWAGLLADLGVVDRAVTDGLDPSGSIMARAVALWRSAPWADADMAHALGAHQRTLRHYRNNRLKGAQWAITRQEVGGRTYRLLALPVRHSGPA